MNIYDFILNHLISHTRYMSVRSEDTAAKLIFLFIRHTTNFKRNVLNNILLCLSVITVNFSTHIALGVLVTNCSNLGYDEFE